MESPFFRSHWSNNQPRPRRSPSYREVPVQRTAARPSPRVVSIPVHFVGSDRSRSGAAVKIQKVFRGFLVRKSVKKIAAVKREVDEIEKKVSRRETVETIRSDAKERLRVNETLMSLLLRLDSVRGVDSGVRDCRKAVIKKAINLQERIDAIVAGDQTIADESSSEVSEPEDDAQETKDSGENAAETERTVPVVDHSSLSEMESLQNLEDEDKATALSPTDEPIPNSSDSRRDTEEEPEALKSQASDGDVEVKAEPETREEETAMEEVENEEEASQESPRTSSNPESDSRSSSENSPDTAREEPAMAIGHKEAEEEEEEEGEEEEGSRRRSNELMERMVEDNEKLMGLMAELFERNTMQTRLLSSLTQRVEQLERAFVCDKLRKKRKQRRDCCTRNPDSNKKF